MRSELRDEMMTVEDAEQMLGQPLMPPDHYSRPGETEDDMWKRIGPD